MSPAAYYPFLIQIALAAIIGVAVVGASHFFGQRSPRNAIKDTPYECGLKSSGTLNTRFTARFFLTAMLFLIFDLEVVFLIPFVFVYRDFLAQHLPILGPMLFFVGVLVLGLYYEVKKGALAWEK